MRYFCPECLEEYRCLKDGLVIRPDGYNNHFHADLYGCRKCKTTILIANDRECGCESQERVESAFDSKKRK